LRLRRGDLRTVVGCGAAAERVRANELGERTLFGPA
jgi:hypothetical protein